MQLPPFGNTLCTSDEIYLFIGRFALDKAEDFQIQRPGTLCLPPYNDPNIYFWPVMNKTVYVFDTGYCQGCDINDAGYLKNEECYGECGNKCNENCEQCKDDYIKDVMKSLIIDGAIMVYFFNSCGKLIWRSSK